jgi:predicted ABC-type transport system involved in lysophospholipase L1 biosynthesis ATPase subunit
VSLLSLEGVCKRVREGRGELTVLQDVSLDIEQGDFIGIWGVRRSGKTTLLEVAAGRDTPDEGRIYFDGADVTRMSLDERARLGRHGGIGLVNADWHPTRNEPVIEHVALPLLSDGMTMRGARAPAWRVLERLGIAGCAHLPADRLSSAERVRVALARALVHDPRVLLVDEPAVLLRPTEATELYELLRSLCGDGRLALVIASEEIAPIRKAGRMFSIDSGQLRAMDPARGMLVQFPGRAQGRPGSA